MVDEAVATGTVIVADNVVRNGNVTDSASTDAMVQGIRRFNQALTSEKRVSATEIQTVGSKGYDGLAIATVVAGACRIPFVEHSFMIEIAERDEPLLIFDTST